VIKLTLPPCCTRTSSTSHTASTGPCVPTRRSGRYRHRCDHGEPRSTSSPRRWGAPKTSPPESRRCSTATTRDSLRGSTSAAPRPPTLAAADPPLHTTHRKAVFPELVARRMLTLEGDIRALCETAIDGALRNDPFEFMGTVGNVVPITWLPS